MSSPSGSKRSKKKKRLHFLMVFDFDQTIVDENTDDVVQEVGNSGPVPGEVKGIIRRFGWTSYMAGVFKHLKSKGITREQIYEVMDAVPLAPGMDQCLRELKELGSETIILSDSNSEFISRILETRGLRKLFKAVFTNPARFLEDGTLDLRPFHRNDDCKLSGANLCKGRVLKEYIKRRRLDDVEFDWVGYVGDGQNDLCPMLGLEGSRDLAFPRRGLRYQILDHMDKMQREQGLKVEAEVTPWENAGQIMDRVRAYVGEREEMRRLLGTTPDLPITLS